MKIAIPVENGRLAPHFGRCPEMMLFTIGDRTRHVVAEQVLETPPHEPGLYPAWLKARGADVVLAGGMGRRAIALFEQAGISVVVGMPCQRPHVLVAALLADELPVGVNTCSHGPNHDCHH